MTYTVIYEKVQRRGGRTSRTFRESSRAGDSREEVERLILEAIEFHIEGLREEGLPIPPPSSFAGVVQVDSGA